MLNIYDTYCILIQSVCYLFDWQAGTNCFESKFDRVSIVNDTLVFNNLIKIFMGNLYPICFPEKKKLLTYNKYGDVILTKEEDSDHVNEFYVISTRKKSKFSLSENLFKCINQTFISISSYCDKQHDCPDDISYDELDCECNNKNSYLIICKYFTLSQKSVKCSFFYKQNANNTCEMYLPLHIHNLSGNNSDKGHISCGRNKKSSFRISDVCYYVLNTENKLIPCQHGEHLESCEDFECNMKFKCPLHYCIPWRYVCDGKWDCPQGLDENKDSVCAIERDCSNMFKCKNSITCIHLGNVCDNNFDCPLKDDEQFCLLKRSKCLANCLCLTYAIRCFNYNEKNPIILNFISFHVIGIINCSKGITNQILHSTYYISILIIKHCSLDQLCEYTRKSKYIILIDAGHNAIKSLKSNCFNKAPSLHTIKVNNNNILHVYEKAFWKLYFLNVLDLSHNPLMTLGLNMIVECSRIEVLYIRGIGVKLQDKNYLRISISE